MNTVSLLGRVTKDIELKGSDNKYCRFTIAINRKYKRDETDFISCVAFSKTAELLSNLSKGELIGLNGRIQTGSYDKDGTMVYTTDIIVDQITFCGGKKGDSQSTNGKELVEVSDGYDDLPFN